MTTRFALPPGYDLAADEVHVWRARLGGVRFATGRSVALLSAEERRRAARFLVEDDRDRFVLARIMARTVIGHLLDVAPALLELELGEHGKPRVRRGAGVRPLDFSIAHSGAWVVLAVSAGRAVGVDVERTRGDLELETMAALCFSARERGEFAALPPGARPDAFFRGWCRKEALLKGLGTGLSDALTELEVGLAPAGPGGWSIPAGRGGGDPGAWRVRDLPGGRGHAAALAVEGAGIAIRCWRVRDDGSVAGGRLTRT